MKTIRVVPALLATATLWASYQSTYSDNLTAIDSSKWSQTGSLSAASNGLTGNGSLISTVSVPTGSDYDIGLTIHTAQQGACTGSYSLYSRSTPNGSTAYVLTASNGSIGLYRDVAGAWTLLTWMPYACTDGTTMRLVVRGNSLTFWSGPNMATYTDVAPIAAGQPGVGISSSQGDTIANVQIGPIDYAAPAAIGAASVATSTAPNRVDLRWPASIPDAESAGLQGYVIYRDGVYLGTSRAPNWLDQTVTGAETAVYSIYAIDQHGTLSAPAQVTVQVPEDPAAAAKAPTAQIARKPTAKSVPHGPTVDQREIGVMPTGSYWGAAGENIDLLSGNLSFAIPLIKAMGRGNSSVTFALSYNSQNWRHDSGGTWQLGQDVGLGLGWKLQAGSIEPLYYNGSTLYYLYTDGTGAQYVLDQYNPNTNVWTSLQAYVWYNANTDTLHFPDGSFWNMNVFSASVEQDAGNQYPSQMEDSNGNFISLTYGPAVGYPYNDTNTSSRITTIYDARRDAGTYPYYSYSLGWGGSGIPHLSSIINIVGTPENYTFTTGAQTLLDPFNSTNFGTAIVLSAVTTTGLGIAYNFQYDSSAEMTQMITPLGGVLNWSYALAAYSTREYMAVATRSMTELAGGSTFNTWGVTYQSVGVDWHTQATVKDNGANTTKVWNFDTDSFHDTGLVTQYQEIDAASTVLLQKSYSWLPSSSSPPSITSLTSTLNPGAAYASSSTMNQNVDSWGNVTYQQFSDYSGSPTGNRQYNMSYTVNSGNYLPAYIFNRMTSATVSQNYGTAYTLSSITYDGYYGCGNQYGMTATGTTVNHDSSYGTSTTYRGNPTSVAGLNGADPVCTLYDSAGVPYVSSDANGHSVNLSTDPSTNFSLPMQASPNANSSMASSATYASSWAPATMTGRTAIPLRPPTTPTAGRRRPPSPMGLRPATHTRITTP